MIRARRAALLAGIALLACLPAAADAAPKRFTSEVLLLSADAEFVYGELTSPSQRCLGGRTIRLAEAGAAAPVTVVQTDDAGRFRIPTADIPATADRLVLTATRPEQGSQRPCGSDTAGLALDAGTLTGGVFGEEFGGRLSSSSPGCVPARTIQVYEITSDAVFVGSNFTDAAGNWVLAAAGGTYEARALPTILGGPDEYTYCRALVSSPWVFEQPG